MHGQRSFSKPSTITQVGIGLSQQSNFAPPYYSSSHENPGSGQGQTKNSPVVPKDSFSSQGPSFYITPALSSAQHLPQYQQILYPASGQQFLSSLIPPPPSSVPSIRLQQNMNQEMVVPGRQNLPKGVDLGAAVAVAEENIPSEYSTPYPTGSSNTNTQAYYLPPSHLPSSFLWESPKPQGSSTTAYEKEMDPSQQTHVVLDLNIQHEKEQKHVHYHHHLEKHHNGDTTVQESQNQNRTLVENESEQQKRF